MVAPVTEVENKNPISNERAVISSGVETSRVETSQVDSRLHTTPYSKRQFLEMRGTSTQTRTTIMIGKY